MSYNDFIKYFDNLEICNLSPDSLQETFESNRKWSMSVFEGEWIKGVSAGGCNDREKFFRNPQYVMQLEHPDNDDEDIKCSVVISLMQKNRRSKKNVGLELLTIGFKIYKLTESDLEEKPLKNNFFKYNTSTAVSTFINLREVSFRFKLLPGYYLIVPATFDPDEDGEFLIRVFSHNKNSFNEHDEKVEIGDIDTRVNFKKFVDNI